MSASCTTKPTTSLISTLTGARWRRLAAVAAVGMAPALGSGQILDVEDSSLTSYLAGATNVQNLRPRAMQRAVHLDGSGRVGDFLGAVAPGHPGSDGGYNRSRTLSGQLDLALGTVTISDVDMALPAEPGGGWVVGRSYNARQNAGGSHHVSSGPMGNNWATSIPEIVLYEGITNADDILYLVAGADRYVEFQRIGVSDDEFKGVNGATGVFQHVVGADSEPDTWTLHLPDGTRMVFFGFDGDADPAEGQFWKKIDASGNTVFVGDETTGSAARNNGYDSGGRVTTVYDETDNDGRRYTYTYNGAGKLTQVEAEIKSGGTYSVTVGTVDYTYYGASEDYGSEHDLKTVTVTTPMSDGTTELIQTKYYRYWKGEFDDTPDPETGETNLGQASALKYVLEFEGYRQADWAGDSSFDGDPLSMAEDETFNSYAAAYFEYDSSQRIASVWFNGECGCTGGANGIYDLSYDAVSFFATSGYDAASASRAIVNRPDGTYVTTYFDEAGQVMGQATTEGNPASSPGDTWATTVVRDSSGRISELSTPANVSGYTHSTGSFARSSAAGLIHVYTRQSGGSLDGFIASYEHKEDTTGTAYLDRIVAYTTRSLTVGSATLVSPFMNSMQIVHADNETTGTLAAADYDQTTTSFAWYEVSDQSEVLYLRPKTITTTLPVVTTATNGSNSANTTARYLRQDGTTAFSEAADDIFTYMEYNDGRMVKRIADCDTDDTGVYDLDPNGHFGITESDAGVHVVTTMTYDAQGRPLATTAPDGDVSMMWFTVLADRTQVTLSAPLVVAGSPDTFHGPAGYSVTSQAGKPVFSGTLFFSGGTTTTDISLWVDETDDMPLEAVATGSATRISTSVYNESGGTLLESRSYFDVPTGTPDWVGTEGSHYDATTFAYDGMGRTIRTEDPTGTISRVAYDTLGRVSSTEVGTDDTGDVGSGMSGTNNMVTVSETVYDGGSAGGNSLVTKTIAHLDDSGTNKRETSYTYDYRGRRVVTVPPTAPYTVVKYDNLGRMLAVAQYSDSSSLDEDTDPTSLEDDRLALSETAYDALGRAWKTIRYKVDPSDGSDDDSIISQSWFDAAGRLVKVQGDQLTKTAYDRLGRVTGQFILATDNDTTYNNALDVAGDKVVEQTVTGYESFNSNAVITTATISRNHSDTSTAGALDTNADGNHAVFTSGNITGRIQIAAYWHDDLHRVTTTGFYGTNAGATFTRSGSAPTIPTSGVLITETSYNDDGTVLDSTDANGIATRTLYDDAGRQTAVIRNYINGAPSGATGDDDLYTRYVYENGLRTVMWVDIDGDNDDTDADDQVTTWIYGSKNGTAGSEIYSNRLVRAIKYPDTSNTGTTATAIDSNDSDVVSFAYNAQGEQIRRKDQAGNIIETTFDGSGRPAARLATTIVSPFDSAVQAIATSYDPLGRVETIIQYDGTDLTPLGDEPTDGVQFTYDDWGNVEIVQQNHDNEVGGGGTDYQVSYAYTKNATTGERQAIKRTGMTMPGGQAIVYNYGAGGSIGDALSRVSFVQIGAGNGTVVATYDYLGLGTVVGTRLPEPVVYSNLYTGATTYGNLDQFNRVASSIWTKDLGTDKDFYDVDITYDAVGNILRTVDNIMTMPTGSEPNRYDNLYSLDLLGRLLGVGRGHWEAGALPEDPGDIVSDQESRSWTLTQTGNWSDRVIDYDGDGVLTDSNSGASPVIPPDLEFSSTTYNEANEWTGRTEVTGNTPPGSPATVSTPYTMTYDAAGNMTSDGKDYNYTYDVFGRLVDVADVVSDSTVKSYRYNGLGWRITDYDGTDTEHLVYNERWQLVATYDGADVREQFVHHAAGLDGRGGSSYIDSVILRNTYTGNGQSLVEDERFYYAQNWRADVSVVLDDAGVQQERVIYSPYGQPFAMPAGDTNFDGDYESGVDGNELAGWSGDGKPFRAYGDVDLDGDVDGDDATAASEHDLGWNVLTSDGASGVNNRLGYAGYIHDRDVATAAHVRYRVYKIDLGRWTQRDPLGYVDGVNLYGYGQSQPVRRLDATGRLSSIVGPGAGCGSGRSGITDSLDAARNGRPSIRFCQRIHPKTSTIGRIVLRNCRMLSGRASSGTMGGVHEQDACARPWMPSMIASVAAWRISCFLVRSSHSRRWTVSASAMLSGLRM